MRARRPRLPMWCAIVLGVVGPAVHAQAQAMAPPFEALPSVLTVGRLVSVTDHRGRTTKGRLIEVSPTVLAVLERDSLGGSRRTTIPAADVVQVRRWDRLWNGLLIGAGIGAGVTAGVVQHQCGPRNRECSANVGNVLAVALVAALAGAGALVDRWFGHEVIFSRPAPASPPAGAPAQSGTLSVAVGLRF